MIDQFIRLHSAEEALNTIMNYINQHKACVIYEPELYSTAYYKGFTKAYENIEQIINSRESIFKEKD